MKKKKRIIYCFALIGILLGLCGCDNKNNSDDVAQVEIDEVSEVTVADEAVAENAENNDVMSIEIAENYVAGILPDTDFSEETLPEELKILDMCSGDIADDGYKDVAIVFEYKEDTTVNGYENYAVGDRVISIFTENENGTYSFMLRNNILIKDSTAGGISGDPYKDISIEDGKLKVSDCGGDADRWGNEWYFEYINSRLSLEKYIYYGYNTNTKNGVAEEYHLEDGYAYRYSIDMNEEDYAPIIISDATFEAEVVKFEETGGEYRIVEFPNVIADAILVNKNKIVLNNSKGIRNGCPYFIENCCEI